MAYPYTASLFRTEHEIFRETFRRFIDEERTEHEPYQAPPPCSPRSHI